MHEGIALPDPGEVEKDDAAQSSQQTDISKAMGMYEGQAGMAKGKDRGAGEVSDGEGAEEGVACVRISMAG